MSRSQRQKRNLLGKTAHAAVLLYGVAASLAHAAVPLAVLDRWNVGGTGGWDYLTLDSTGHRLFVSRGTRVDVIDTAEGKLVASIADTNGVHGIALAEELHRGFTSNGRADSVSAIDLDTLKTLKEVAIPGHNPDAILYERSGKHVFTFNGGSKDVTVLDADSLGVVRTLAVPDKPEFAVDDGNGQIFVNIESAAGQIAVIDARRLTVKAVWPLPGCATPTGLAIDKSHHRLFSVCDGKVMAVTDADTGRQIAKVAIGEGPDAAAYDSARGLVFSSNGDGTLSVIHQLTADRYEVLQSVKTQRGARTMALDPAAGKIYLVSANFGAAPEPTSAQPHPALRRCPIRSPFSWSVPAANAKDHCCGPVRNETPVPAG